MPTFWNAGVLNKVVMKGLSGKLTREHKSEGNKRTIHVVNWQNNIPKHAADANIIKQKCACCV